jgi:hypothetical protein
MPATLSMEMFPVVFYFSELRVDLRSEDPTSTNGGCYHSVVHSNMYLYGEWYAWEIDGSLKEMQIIFPRIFENEEKGIFFRCSARH